MKGGIGETLLNAAFVHWRSEGQWKNAPYPSHQNSTKQLTKNQIGEKSLKQSCIEQHYATTLRYNTMNIDEIIEDELERQQQPQNLEKQAEEPAEA